MDKRAHRIATLAAATLYQRQGNGRAQLWWMRMWLLAGYGF